MVERGIPILCEVDMSEELRKRVLALYKPPFSYHCGYIHDGEGNMVSDLPIGTIATRVRGWGRISYLENAEELQDTVGEMIAEALNQYWDKQNGLIPLPEGEGWVRWVYSEEVPFPKLERDPYIHVQWSNGEVDDNDWPVSFWHSDGTCINNFCPAIGSGWQIVAYKVVGENPDFEESERIAAENLAAEESLLP